MIPIVTLCVFLNQMNVCWGREQLLLHLRVTESLSFTLCCVSTCRSDNNNNNNNSLIHQFKVIVLKNIIYHSDVVLKPHMAFFLSQNMFTNVLLVIVHLIAVQFLFICIALFTTQNHFKADLQPTFVSLKQCLWAQMNMNLTLLSIISFFNFS